MLSEISSDSTETKSGLGVESGLAAENVLGSDSGSGSKRVLGVESLLGLENGLEVEPLVEVQRNQDAGTEDKLENKSENTIVDLFNQSEGNSNDSEYNGQKLNGLDAKFKVWIYFLPINIHKLHMISCNFSFLKFFVCF